MEQPKVSIIVNCLNGEAYLREALDSIYAQTFQDWEVVFWDNASTDSSPEIAQQYDDRIHYFRAKEKTSLGEGRKQAFKRARGEFIGILDVDDLWLPEKLEKQLPLFEDPDVGLVVNNSMYFDEEGDQFDCFSKSPPKRGFVFKDLLARNFMASQAMLFRASALQKMEYIYDAQFTMVCDFDLTLRVAANHKVDYCDEILSKWRMHSQSETSTKKHLFAIENKKLVSKLIKEYPKLHQKYKDSFEYFGWLVDLQLGLDAWQAGEVKQARSFFALHKNNNYYSRMAYIGTIFFPFQLHTEIFELVKKLRRVVKRGLLK